MIIRAPHEEDTAVIIELLQLSLGESKLKKTREIWDFKHNENPFGVSPVFLAEENTILVGVRAFMQWRWQLGEVVWTSYRAVDTGTHPDFQGRGIFKKLTLHALSYVMQLGDCFVFNTPNDQSRPGYLKMGWQEVAKIKVAILPISVFSLAYLFYKRKYGNSISEFQLDELCRIYNSNLQSKNVLFTPKSAAYLKWRYEENPLQDYIVVSSPDYYVAMYVKKHRFFNELRVVETISVFDAKIRSSLRRVISQYAFQNGCLLITTSDKELFFFRIYGSYGPILTFKSLTHSENFTKISLDINNWSYSLGDLELF